MKKADIKTSFVKNLFTTMLLLGMGLAFLASLASCDNFLNGSQVQKEIEDAIAYANATDISVTVSPQNNLQGQVTTGNRVTVKIGYPFTVNFVVADAYTFGGWVAYQNFTSLTDTPLSDEYIEFSDEDGKGPGKNPKCTVIIKKKIENLWIVPICCTKPSVILTEPLAAEKDISITTPIKITFNKKIDLSSIQQKDEDGNVIGFKNFKVTYSSSDEDENASYGDVTDYFDASKASLKKNGMQIVIPFKEKLDSSKWLPQASYITVELGANIACDITEGGALLDKSYTWTFVTGVIADDTNESSEKVLEPRYTQQENNNEDNIKNARVVILYDLNGGTLPDDAPLVYTYGKKLELKDPVYEPYTFDGFYFNADFSGEKVTFLDDEYAYGYILFAKWNYKIIYDDNYDGGEIESVKYDDIDLINNSLKIPERKGYTFVDWYLNNEFTDSSINSWNTNENKGDVILYAKWEINEYTITYKDDYGLSPEPVKVNYNTVLDEMFFPDLTDEDHNFIEWKENGNVVKPGYVVTGDTVFTATIEPLYYTVKFEGFLYFGHFNETIYDSQFFSSTLRIRIGSMITESDFSKIPLKSLKITKFGVFGTLNGWPVFILGAHELINSVITENRVYSIEPRFSGSFSDIYEEDGYIKVSANLNDWCWERHDANGRGAPMPCMNIFIGDIGFRAFQEYQDPTNTYVFDYNEPPFAYDPNIWWTPNQHAKVPCTVFEEGTYKCYATYGKYLLPVNGGNDFFPLSDDPFIKPLDQDEIPEGYYRTITIHH